jgi:hypothetical protein
MNHDQDDSLDRGGGGPADGGGMRFVAGRLQQL